MSLQAAASIIILSIIIIWTIRGCVYCWKSFEGDNVAQWLTVAEVLASIAWILIAIDSVIAAISPQSYDLLGGVFWLAFGSKAVSSVLKAEKGYKAILNTYRGLSR